LRARLAARALVLSLLFVGAAAHGQSRPEAKPSEGYRDQIVAEVEHEPITLHELDLSARLTAEYRDLKDSQPGNHEALRQSLQKQLELLVDERILLLECTKEKITLAKDDEKRVEREVDRQAEPQGGLEGLKAVLKKIGVPYEYFVEKKRTSLLIGKLLLKNVSRDIYVEPERIRKYYEEHKREAFRREAVTKFFEIDVYNRLDGARVPDDVAPIQTGWNDDAAMKYAASIRERAAKSPGEWRAIATAATMDASAVEKGGLVQVSGGKPLADEIGILGEAADKLKVGEVSPVVPSKLGYHVLCMKERSGPDVLPFSEVQREISEKLRNEIWHERLNAWIKRVKDEAITHVYTLPTE
jgi:hypothetical protein